jgi:hypothetical protein
MGTARLTPREDRSMQDMIGAHRRYVTELGDPEQIEGLDDQLLFDELEDLTDYLEPVDAKRARRDRIYRVLIVRGHQQKHIAERARVSGSAVGQSVKALNRREGTA